MQSRRELIWYAMELAREDEGCRVKTSSARSSTPRPTGQLTEAEFGMFFVR